MCINICLISIVILIIASISIYAYMCTTSIYYLKSPVFGIKGD